MEVILVPLVSKIVEEGATLVFKTIQKSIIKRWKIYRFVSSLKKKLGKAFESGIYDFEDYARSFLDIDNLDEISEETLNKMIVGKFEKIFQQEFVSDILDAIKEKIKKGYSVISFRFLQENFTMEFFRNIFGFSKMSEKNLRVVDLIREVFFECVLSLYDFEELQKSLVILHWKDRELSQENYEKLSQQMESLSTKFESKIRYKDIKDSISKSLDDLNLPKTRFSVNQYYRYLVIRDINSIMTSNTKSKFSGEQFEIYKKLWVLLYRLKQSADDLWETVSFDNLQDFGHKLSHVQDQLSEYAIFIEKRHYRQLERLVKTFKIFFLGKGELYGHEKKKMEKAKKKGVFLGVYEFTDEEPPEGIVPDPKQVAMIHNNRVFKDQYSILMDEIRISFHEQIKSEEY